jgi:DnaJ-class molecular chaperone
MDISL